MQNWIVFETVTDSYREFAAKRQKKLKRKENFISGEDFSFHEMKIFPMKNSCSKWKKKRRRCRIEFSFERSQIEIDNLWLNGRRNWKERKISFIQRNSAYTELKFFLSKIRRQSRRRQGGDAELNSLSNCHKLRSRIWVWTVEEMEKKGDFIGGEDFSF